MVNIVKIISELKLISFCFLCILYSRVCKSVKRASNACRCQILISPHGEQTYCRKPYQYKMPKDVLCHFAKFFFKNIVLVQNAENFNF